MDLMIPQKQALVTDFSLEGKEELLIYHEKVCGQIYLLQQAFAERDPEKAVAMLPKPIPSPAMNRLGPP